MISKFKSLMVLDYLAYLRETDVLVLDVIRISCFRPVSSATYTREKCAR
jgi:hypothetical protein